MAYRKTAIKHFLSICIDCNSIMIYRLSIWFGMGSYHNRLENGIFIMKTLVKSYLTYLERKNIAMLENTKADLKYKPITNAILYAFGVFFPIIILTSVYQDVVLSLHTGHIFGLVVFVLIHIAFCLALLTSVFSVIKINNITFSGEFMSIKTVKFINRFISCFVLVLMYSKVMPIVVENYQLNIFTSNTISLTAPVMDIFMLFVLILFAKSMTMAILQGIKMKSENELTI